MKINLNQKGFTLVELLATLVILTIISILLFSVINNGKSQFTDQTRTNKELSEVSYALKLMTKDIRQYGNVSIEVVADDEEEKIPDTLLIDNYEYKVVDTSLIKKNKITGTIEATFDNINFLDLDMDADDFVSIKIVYDEDSTISTKIYIRQ